MQGAIQLRPAGHGRQERGQHQQGPLFADPDNGDFHLKSKYGRYSPAGRLGHRFGDEPCIDTGDPDEYPRAELRRTAIGSTWSLWRNALCQPERMASANRNQRCGDRAQQSVENAVSTETILPSDQAG